MVTKLLQKAWLIQMAGLAVAALVIMVILPPILTGKQQAKDKAVMAQMVEKSVTTVRLMVGAH